MEQLKNEQTQEIESHPAEAEEVKGEKEEGVSLGKFKDVKALLTAYNSLESEFTKRCQKIKELEGKLGAVDKAEDKNKEAPTKTQSTSPENVTDKKQAEDLLKEYLMGVVEKKQSATLLDGSGVGVRTPISRPKTIREAGQLAKEIFDKK